MVFHARSRPQASRQAGLRQHSPHPHPSRGVPDSPCAIMRHTPGACLSFSFFDTSLNFTIGLRRLPGTSLTPKPQALNSMNRKTGFVGADSGTGASAPLTPHDLSCGAHRPYARCLPVLFFPRHLSHLSNQRFRCSWGQIVAQERLRVPAESIFRLRSDRVLDPMKPRLRIGSRSLPPWHWVSLPLCFPSSSSSPPSSSSTATNTASLLPLLLLLLLPSPPPPHTPPSPTMPPLSHTTQLPPLSLQPANNVLLASSICIPSCLPGFPESGSLIDKRWVGAGTCRVTSGDTRSDPSSETSSGSTTGPPQPPPPPQKCAESGSRGVDWLTTPKIG